MILYIIYRITQVIVMILPIKSSFWLASRIADIHYAFSKKDRDLVIGNLTKVFGKNDKRTRRVAREVLRNFGKYLVEFLRFSRMGDDYIEKHVQIEGVDNLRDALKSKKGAVLFSAHLGNWEWGGSLVANLGFPISAIAWAHKDKRVNDFFVSQRALGGMGSIPLGGSIRRSIKLLAKNETIAILPDRDFSNNSVRVEFFGKQALAPVGIGLLALKTNCPLVPVFVIRQKDDTHRFIIEKALEYRITKDKETDIKNIVSKAINTIERYVKEYPEQWFMFDNPWKDKNNLSQK
jgi:KDO2-lipid IV(A) lauroyltransferase